jgi:tRNA G10  N-methylase Trm11
MCGIRVGAVVLDPMCGCGTIATTAHGCTVAAAATGGTRGGPLPEPERERERERARVRGREQEFPDHFTLLMDAAGEAVAKAAFNTRCNEHSRVRALTDVVRADARRLPLRSGAVEHVVTDMPFGKVSVP